MSKLSQHPPVGKLIIKNYGVTTSAHSGDTAQYHRCLHQGTGPVPYLESGPGAVVDDLDHMIGPNGQVIIGWSKAGKSLSVHIQINHSGWSVGTRNILALIFKLLYNWITGWLF